MNFLLLGPPYKYAKNSFYRGTKRLHVRYAEELPEEASINQAFLEHVRVAGESGVLHDLQVASRIHQVVAAHGQRLDLVEAVPWPGEPTVGGRFLGYDVSCGFANSFISDWGADAPLLNPADFTADDMNQVGAAEEGLYALWYHHCLGLLNEHRLFANPTDALWCLVGGSALQALQPGILEYGTYEVVGLWLIA